MFKNLEEIENLSRLLRYSSEIWSLKNLNSSYIGATTKAAQFVGFDNADDIIGKYDWDLPANASQNTLIFQKNDQQVINSKQTLQFISFDQYRDDNWHLLYSTRSPLILENGDVVGLLLKSIDITDIGLLNYGIMTSQTLSSKIIQKKTFSVAMQTSYHQINLSRQESLCLFYFLQSYPIKKISNFLKVSPSSVETYLERVKHKLGCHNRSQLIEKMHAINLAHILLS